MISYTIIYLVSYYGLYRYLPIFQDQEDCPSQVIRHILLLYISFQLTSFLWRQRIVPKLRIRPFRQAVFISGCDTGFGNLFARKLDERGYRVFAGCLFPNGPNAKKLKAETSDLLKIVKLDVTSEEQVLAAQEEVERELERHNCDLLAVVNNAGILALGELEFGKSIQPCAKLMEVNCLGTIRVTRAFIPLLRRCRTSPRLINVTSMSARFCFPGMIAYRVSKSAALSFTDGIRVELKKWGIQTVSIEPHLFKTDLLTLDAQQKALRELWLSSSPMTRSDYGEEYFEAAQKFMYYIFGSAKTSCVDVIEAMFDSVTVSYPDRNRKIFSSELERLTFWFIVNIVPSALEDFALHMIARIVGGKPAFYKSRK